MFIRLAMLCLLACVGLARAQGTLEVIPLHNRTVEEVMPSLRPLLEPGGTLTGMQGQLILRASDANRAEIKQALAALDTIPRQLTITVRQSLNRSDTRQSAELFGKIDGRHVDITLPPAGTGGAQLEIAGDSARIGARLDDRSLDQVSQVSQHLRVADGGRALIHASVELPYTLRERVAGPHGTIERESVVFRSVGKAAASMSSRTLSANASRSTFILCSRPSAHRPTSLKDSHCAPRSAADSASGSISAAATAATSGRNANCWQPPRGNRLKPGRSGSRSRPPNETQNGTPGGDRKA